MATNKISRRCYAKQFDGMAMAIAIVLLFETWTYNDMPEGYKYVNIPKITL